MEAYYKNWTALYTVTIVEDHINDAVPAIREIIGEDNAMTGSAVSTAVATESTVKEIKKIAVIAVMINAGSNLIFGEISFVTNAAGSAL